MGMTSFVSNSTKFLLCTAFSSTNKSNDPILAVLDRPSKMRIPYQIKDGQSRIFHELPSGLNMEVIVQKSLNKKESANQKKPPLVFIHGSYHAAWCWAEFWLPFFSESGYDCYAVSLLGQGESDAPSGPVAGSLQTHATDVSDFIQRNIKSPPILLGHSFGGIVVQSYISNLLQQSPHSENKEQYAALAGSVLICSVPPSGNSQLIWRYLLSKPITAFKVTYSLAAKGFTTSLPLCKETFFSASMEDHQVQRYQELMKESSRLPLFDLKKLNASLPMSPVPRNFIDVLVLGAANDYIQDPESLKETAEFYGVPPICLEGVAHDMMIDFSWEKGAQKILSWLQNLKQKEIAEGLLVS